MRKIASIAVCLGLLSCSQGKKQRPLIDEDQPLDPSGKSVIVVSSPDSLDDLKEDAKAAGLEVEGDAIVVIEGDNQAIKDIVVDSEAPITAVLDSPIVIEEGDVPTPDASALFLAKKDFGIDSFLQKNPESDGRGVIVGVIDDGISPFHSGFQKTTTGERKLLKKGSNSTALIVPVLESKEHSSMLTGVLAESESIDLDGDRETKLTYNILVDPSKDPVSICIDLNVDDAFDVASECVEDFNQRLSFIYWDVDQTLTLVATFDSETQTVQFHQGERAGDSHGEGVASVMAGHNIGNRFSGVAPGAQIIDYDLSSPVTDLREGQYSINTFLKALDWLGSQGAEVINISYSLFFHSPASQQFMSRAIEDIIKKYNIVISFSAGNNGPGLGSMNRAMIYPDTVLAVGAYASKELTENVHGTTGLPDDGYVIRYSSRGPGPDQGSSPSVIAPLASIVHRNIGQGFGGFSGTSSAAPAAGGFAAVLISHLKQLDLPVDAGSVVNAVKQSGKPLANVPYVVQGFGLPQIDRAIGIYKEIIKGERPMAIVSGVSDFKNSPVSKSGLLIFASDLAKPQEMRTSLRAKFSELYPKADQANALLDATLESNQAWLSGPQRALLSLGTSSQFFAMDLGFASELKGGEEVFAEITIRNSKGERLGVIPVTFINDVTLTTETLTTDVIELLPEQGKRFHIHLPEGTTGLFHSFEVIEGNASRLSVSIYGPSGRSLGRTSSSEFGSFLALDEGTTRGPGWYQVALVRSGGTKRPLKARVTLKTMAIKLTTNSSSFQQPNFWITNQGEKATVDLELREAPELIKQEQIITPISKPMVYRTSLEQEGQFLLQVSNITASPNTYWRPGCIATYSKGEGEDEEIISQVRAGLSTLVNVTEDNLGQTLELSCRSFEYSEFLESESTLAWQVATLRPAASSDPLAEGTTILNGFQAGEASLSWMGNLTEEQKTPGTYDLYIKSAIPGSQSHRLGSVTLY